MDNSSICIIGQKIQLDKYPAGKLKRLNMGEKLSFDFYDGVYGGANMLFVKPKGNNPTPRKCAIVSERLSQIFKLPVVFILKSALAYERQRLMEKHVYFVMTDKYAHLPMLVAMERVSARKIPTMLTPVAQYILLYHLQVENIEGKSTKAIASLMPYSYESVSLGLTCLSDIGLSDKVPLDSKRKTIRFRSAGKELWKTSGKYLINPVERRIYCDDVSTDKDFPVCGINALAHYSFLNPDSEKWVMMTAKEYKVLNSGESIVNPNEFDGPFIIEIWKYPPVFRKDKLRKYVDRLSLALSLKSEEDPRVEEEVERMMNGIKW